MLNGPLTLLMMGIFGSPSFRSFSDLGFSASSAVVSVSPVSWSSAQPPALSLVSSVLAQSALPSAQHPLPSALPHLRSAWPPLSSARAPSPPAQACSTLSPPAPSPARLSDVLQLPSAAPPTALPLTALSDRSVLRGRSISSRSSGLAAGLIKGLAGCHCGSFDQVHIGYQSLTRLN